MHSWKNYEVKIFETVLVDPVKPELGTVEVVKEKIKVKATGREHAFNLAGAQLAEREKQALLDKHVEEIIDVA